MIFSTTTIKFVASIRYFMSELETTTIIYGKKTIKQHYINAHETIYCIRIMSTVKEVLLEKFLNLCSDHVIVKCCTDFYFP